MVVVVPSFAPVRKQEILLKANEEETKQNLNYVGRCEVPLDTDSVPPWALRQALG